MKLNYDELLSNVAFSCKLRHYSEGGPQIDAGRLAPDAQDLLRGMFQPAPHRSGGAA